MSENDNIKKIIGEYMNLKNVESPINKKIDILYDYAKDSCNYNIEERLVALRLMVDLMEKYKEKQN